MLDSLKKNILTAKELFGMPPESAFLERFGLKELKPINEKTVALIRENHSYYTAQVSSAGMAASLELSLLMYRLAITLQPKTALDLGTGFSSYVLRLAASNSTGFTVYSVDDDTTWLSKTVDYLQANKVTAEHVLGLEEFNAQPGKSFDLVLLDLNFVEVRKDYIAAAISMTNPKGVIVFDDTHKIEYLRQVKEQAQKKNVTLYDFRNSTLDAFKRFAVIGIK